MAEISTFKIFLIIFNISCLTILVFKYTKSAIVVILTILFIQYAVYGYARYVEPNWIGIEKIAIKNRNFPDGIDRLKIIQISDLHIKKNSFREKSMVRMVNGLRPDLVLITGDFLTERDGLPALIEVLSKIKAKKGIYGIFGDIDSHAFNGVKILELKAALENINVNILNNENIEIPLANGGEIALIGFTSSGDKKAFLGIESSMVKIVMTHYPNLVNSQHITPETADLVLAGDTHGGQFGLPFVRNYSNIINSFKYLSGLYYVKGVPLYVNRGIGMHGMNIRFFCRPEITEIRFVKN